jgi:hypothetical protein
MWVVLTELDLGMGFVFFSYLIHLSRFGVLLSSQCQSFFVYDLQVNGPGLGSWVSLLLKR